jgi:4-hydroxy-tetrahydrodipicolinate synthase
MNRLRGTGVALVTPFDENGNVDFNGLSKLLKHTAKGVDYYVVLGTTGESATLTKEEKKQVLKFVKENNPSKLPIVFGIGGNSTQDVLHQIAETKCEGIDAILSVSPYYNKPTQEGIFRHFTAIADVSPVPIILYNVPGRTASNITASTTLRLASHSNIVGIKEASGNFEQCLQIAKEKPKNFLLISGDDMLTVPLASIGGAGVISVLANAYPVIFKKLDQAIREKDFSKASKELFKLVDINPLMYEEANPVGLKYLLSQLGICSSEVRLPLIKASEPLQGKITQLAKGIK